MNDSIVFYNEIGLNGRYQVMTKLDLKGSSIKKIGSDCITTQKNVIYKGLNNYWVSKEALKTIRENNNTERAFF